MPQIEQPYRFRPGSTLSLEWDWSTEGWLPDGVGISAFVVTLGAGLTQVGSPIQSGGVVTVVATLDPSFKLGKRTIASCKITTAQSPPLIDSRDIAIIAATRSLT